MDARTRDAASNGSTTTEQAQTTEQATTEQARITLPAPGAYRLAPGRSSVRFRVRKLGLFAVRGTFGVSAGHVVVTAEGAEVYAELDAASFTTANRKRDTDVRGRRFLDAVHYPTLRFSGRLAAGDTVIRGELSGHGTATPVELAVTALHTDAHHTEAQATTVVDRTALGVTAGRGIAGRHLDVELCVTLLPAVRTSEGE